VISSPGSPSPATRLATDADIPSVMQLEREAATAAHWSREQYNAIFSPDSRRMMLLLEHRQVFVGFLVASSVDHEWEIENIVVAAESRRHGFGKLLVHEFLAYAKSRGARAVFLEVRESNLPARTLYENSGFLPTGRRTGYFGDPTEDAILYRLFFR
jgi:ribosomal-protein-alanine N-acetyltransferase